jgi:hypothetical protein
MRKFFVVITTIALLICALCVTASAAEIAKPGFTITHDAGITPSIGTPIAAYGQEALTEGSDVLAELDKLAAEAGYEAKEGTGDNILRWYTSDDEGIVRNVLIGQGYVFVSSLDTNSDFPCGACFMFSSPISMDGTAAWDMDSGNQLFA